MPSYRFHYSHLQEGRRIKESDTFPDMKEVAEMAAYLKVNCKDVSFELLETIDLTIYPTELMLSSYGYDAFKEEYEKRNFDQLRNTEDKN